MNKIYQIEEDSLFELVEIVVERIVAQYNAPVDRWIDGKEAMKKLGIKSATTLQKYRDEGKIRYTKSNLKTIMYDRFSIDEFLDQNARETF